MGGAVKGLGISVAGLMVPAAMVIVSAGAASAATRPPTDWSYYVTSGDSISRAQALGCNQARADNSLRVDSFVTMDFGAQRSNGAGTYLPSSTVYWPNGSDENYALWFAYGYQKCKPRHQLILAIGTSNDGVVTDGALGADWGAVVQHVASVASRDGYASVAVQGAIDAEPGYGPFAHFEGWEFGDRSGKGYVSKTKALISDFGSADGCPQPLGQYKNVLCSNGWYVSSEYDAIWGWAPNEGTPEIYFNGCYDYAEQANQWANISDWGKHYGRQGKVRFVGPLSQGFCLSPAQAWSDFNAALKKDGVADVMRFSTQIVTK